MDMRPAFDSVHSLIVDVEKKQFATEGAAYSGSWAPLAPSTVRHKARRGLDPRILHATLRMMRSFTATTHADHVYRASADEMFVGSRVPYARYHQLGTRRMPRRRPFELDEAVRRNIVKILQAHLMGVVAPTLREYTTKAGVTRMATDAQIANWTKGSR